MTATFATQAAPATVVRLTGLLGEDGAAAHLRLRDSFPSFGLYSNEGFDTRYAPGLPQRFDSAMHYIGSGGRFGRKEEVRILARRTNYFRDTYSYGDKIVASGIEPFLRHEGFVAAARQVHGRPIVEPAIVYANLLAPGQELAVHTDVPEFRGANRTIVPQWLLVVMHHSGLFEHWRMPIATAIAYFGGGVGGELVHYPDGVDGQPATISPTHDTAVVLDTDSVFHGVDRVGGDESRLEILRPGQRLHPAGDERWVLRDPDGDRLAEFGGEELRYSVSWKAYCFEDEADRSRWKDHADDLTLDAILDRLETDCRSAGALDGDRPDPEAFGKLLVDRYVRFPAPTQM